MNKIDQIRTQALKALLPPPRLLLSEWIEREVILPDGVSSQPGPVRLWPFQREIADAIGDPLIERVTLVKPVRVGFTTLLSSAVASFVANDPAPILALLPAESDCRDYVVSDIEPIFSASPAVADALHGDLDEAGRNTLLSRRFPGGSLKIVAAKSPRNLRRHNVRFLLMDEVDGMTPTPEGSPILLAERRTLSFPDRKIVLGSTPVHEETSHVLRSYALSDQRVYEVPCPHCSDFSELNWSQIEWPDGEPEKAYWVCPSCGSVIEEGHKPQMVANGQWRATKPEISGHAGFRMNALISLHSNASWGKLAKEFVDAKDDPTTLQTFVNTILGQGWRAEGDELDEGALSARGESFGLKQVPAEVLAITVGADVQHDRLELTYIGWTEDNVALVLGHKVIWGAFDAAETWTEMDALLRERFSHQLGGKIGVDAAAIDAGDGTSMNVVTAFCRPRTNRKIFAIKGAAGNRPIVQRSGSRTKTGAKLWIVGVDTVKRQLFAKIQRSSQFRFSEELPDVWFEQVTSERAVIRYTKGQPVHSFERIPGKRAEALDCVVYAFAARQLVNINSEQRLAQLSEQERSSQRKKGPVLNSSWMSR